MAKSVEQLLREREQTATNNNLSLDPNKKYRGLTSITQSPQQGNSFGLDKNVLSRVADTYKSQWGSKYYYDAFDPEDFQRMQAGGMPRYLDAKYDLDDPYDRYLYDNNLPYRELFNDMYSEAVKDYNAEVESENKYQQEYDAFRNELYKAWSKAADASDNGVSDEQQQALFDILTSGQYDSVAQNYLEPDAEEIFTISDYNASRKKSENKKGFSSDDLWKEYSDLLEKAQREQQAEQNKPGAATAGALEGSAAGSPEQVSAYETLRGQLEEKEAQRSKKELEISGWLRAGDEPRARRAKEELAALDDEITNARSALDGLKPARAAELAKKALADQNFKNETQLVSNREDERYKQLTKGWNGTAKSVFDHINNVPESDFKSTLKMYTTGTGFDYLEPGYVAWRMTDEERAVFNHYAKTGGQDAAMEYYNALLPTLNARYEDYLEKDPIAMTAEEAAENMENMSPVLASYAGAVTQPLTAIEGYVTQLQGGAGLDVAANDPRLQTARTTQLARQKVSEDMSAAGQFFYQTGMSMLDNVARLPMGKAGLGMMAGSVMASRTDELLEQGATSEQALAGAAAAAAIEVVTEKVSLDKLLTPKNIGNAKHFVIEALKQGGVEASEEMASEVLNLLADVAIRGEDAEFNQSIAQYMESGMTAEQARAKAYGDLAADVLLAGAGGFLSGGVMGSGSNAIGIYSTGADFTDAPLAVKRNIQTGLDIGKAYREAAQGGKTLSAQLHREVAVDLGAMGLDQKTTKSFTKMLDEMAQLPQSWASEQGRAAIEKFAQTVTQRAAAMRSRDASLTAAQTRAQTRLNTLYTKITAAQEAANAAKGAGDVKAYTKAVADFRSAMQNYREAVTTAKADVNAKQVKTQADNQKDRDAVTSAGKATEPVVAAEYQRIRETVASVENEAELSERLAGASQEQLAGVLTAARDAGDRQTYDAVQQIYDLRYGAGAAGQAVPGSREIDMTDYAMNGGRTTFQDGVNRLDSKRKLSRTARTQLRVLDALGKRYGAQIVIEDTISYRADDGKVYSSAANGYFDPADGTIHLAIDAEEGAYMYFAVHELTHKIKAENAEGYRLLADFIEERLNSSTEYKGLSYSGNTLDERIRSVIDHYAAGGRTLTPEQARDELIADAMPVILADKATVRDFVRMDRTLAQRVYDFFEDFYAALTEITAKVIYGGDRQEAQALAADQEAVRAIADMFKAALEGGRIVSPANDRGQGVQYSPKRIPNSTIAATEDEAKELELTDPRNVVRYREKVTAALNKTLPSSDMILLGRPSSVLAAYMKSDRLLYMPQKAARKAVLTNSEGGKHGLDRIVLDELPYQLTDPMAITGNTTEHENANDNSIVVWTDWATQDGDSIVVPIRIDAVGRVELYNNVNTVFDAWDEQYVSDLLRDGNVLYTRNGENILDLMGQQREVLKRSIEDVSTDNMPQKEKYVKTESAKKKQLSLKSQVQKDAVAHFGKTYSWNETGYVLTDGTKLDFSGRHEGGPGGYRSVDHREVVDAFGEDSDLSGNGAMVQFMADGAIRIMPESGGINLSVEPTAEQMQQLSSFVSKNRGEVIIDFDDTNGNTLHSVEYPQGTHANRVLNDISEYFRNGTVPVVSDVQRFHQYSMKSKPATLFTEQEAADNAAELDRVRAENERLSGMVDALREQFKITKGYRPNEKALNRVARSILRKYSSKYDQAQLTEDLRGLFDTIGNEKEFDGDTAMATATAIARKVLDKSSERDDSVYEASQAAREYFRNGRFTLSETQRAEVESKYDGYNNFRKAVMGRLNLTNDGAPLDQQWEEISGLFPEYFDPDTNEGDQPAALAEFFEAAYARPYVNPFGTLYDMDDAAYDLAAELFNDFFRVPQVQTFADKQRDKLNEANRAYRAELDKMRQEYEDRYNDAIALTQGMREIETRKLMDEYEGKLDDQKSELRAKYRAMVSRKNRQMENQAAAFREWKKTDRAKRNEHTAQRKYRTRIERNAKELRTWLTKPTRDKHVPAILASSIADLLSNIDMEVRGPSVRAKTWKESIQGLSEAFRQYQRDDGRFDDFRMTLPEGYVEALDMLAGSVDSVRRFGDMDAEQMKELDYIVAVAKGAVQNANRLFANQRYKTIAEAGESTVKEGETRKQKRSRLGPRLDKLINADSMDAFTFAHALGEGAESIVKGLEAGSEKSYERIKQGAEAIERMKAEAGVTVSDINKWSDKKSAIDIELSGGKTVQMTPAQMMSFYLLSKRKQARQHITDGGIEIHGRRKGKEDQISVFKVTEQDIDTITDRLTDKQRAFADGMQHFLATDTAAWGNEVWMQLYAYEMFGEPDYWPITVAKAGIKQEDPSAARAFNAILNIGATKDVRPAANNPLVIDDAFDTFSSHVAQMARLNGLAPAVEDAMKWFNYVSRDASGLRDYNRSTKKTVEKILGEDGSNYFIQLMKDINGLSTGSTGTEIPQALLRNYKRAAIAGKLRVVVQQPTSIIRAMCMVNPKFFTGKPNGSLRENIQQMREHSPLAWWKSNGNYEIGTGRSMRGILLGAESMLDDVMNKAMAPAGLADDVAWGSLWSAVKREVQAYHPGLDTGSEEYMQRVTDRFNDVVTRTQVVDTVLHRSQMMRSKDTLSQMASSFMSEPTKTVNMVRNAVLDVALNKPNAKKNLAKTLIALLVSLAANSAVKALHDTIRDRDDADDFSALYAEKFTDSIKDDTNPLNYFPVLKDVVSLMQGFDVERMDMSAIAQTLDSCKNIVKWVQEGDSKYTPYKLISDLAKDVGSVTGLPIPGLLSTAEFVVNAVNPGAIRRYEVLDKEQRKQLRESGLDRRDFYGMMAGYDKTTNAAKAYSILTYDGDGDGKADFSDGEMNIIAELLGLSYDSSKDGSLARWAKGESDSYLKRKKTDLKNGKITQEEYDALKQKYDDFYETAMGLN